MGGDELTQRDYYQPQHSQGKHRNYAGVYIFKNHLLLWGGEILGEKLFLKRGEDLSRIKYPVLIIVECRKGKLKFFLKIVIFFCVRCTVPPSQNIT